MGARAWRANRVAPCGRGGGRPRTWLRWEWRNAVRVARNPTGAPETAPVLGSRDARRGVRLSAPRCATLRSLPAGRVFTRAYTNTPKTSRPVQHTTAPMPRCLRGTQLHACFTRGPAGAHPEDGGIMRCSPCGGRRVQ